MSAVLLVVIVVGLLVLAGLAAALVLARRIGAAGPSVPVPATTGPRKGSDGEIWIRRGERAATTLRGQVGQASGQPVASQLADVGSTAESVLVDLRRVGAQLRSVEDSLFSIDAPRLRAQSVDATGSVAEQLAVAERLGDVRGALLDRMQATVIGLEGLSAQVAEVLALAATSGGVDRAADRVEDLSGQLEGLRYGLVQTEQISRTTLRALPPGSAGEA